MMTRTLTALALIAATQAPAQTTVEDYVGDNLIAIFYHELGHALIDVMLLPVFGQEEDAADVLSVLMVDELFEEESAAYIVTSAAYSFAADAALAEDEGWEIPWWSTHGQNLQRYYNTICLFYGGNPDMREDLAIDLGLPAERAETCIEEYELAIDSWGPVLDELYEAGGGTTLVYRDAGRFNNPWSQLTAEIISEEVAALNADLSLPEPVSVLVEPCGEANAFYDPNTRDIIMCTEFAEYLSEQFGE